MFTEADQHWMGYALELAGQAAQQHEVPVGAVLVWNNELIGAGFNQSIAHNDPSAHAEIMAMRQAATALENYRLLDTTLYVTLEPCMMCAGAMIHARVKTLIYGAPDPKSGAVASAGHFLDAPFHNHRMASKGGLMAAACGDVLKAFFRSRR